LQAIEKTESITLKIDGAHYDLVLVLFTHCLLCVADLLGHHSTCRWQIQQYTSSALEQKWVDNAREWSHEICARVWEDYPTILKYVEAVMVHSKFRICLVQLVQLSAAPLKKIKRIINPLATCKEPEPTG
jgi:hypothetical protein